jgi:hypothetical protein
MHSPAFGIRVLWPSNPPPRKKDQTDVRTVCTVYYEDETLPTTNRRLVHLVGLSLAKAQSTERWRVDGTTRRITYR